MKNWDCNKNKYVARSKKIEAFFNEIESVCRKHGYSISHEDGHGSFEIEEYKDSNIDWLKNANLNIGALLCADIFQEDL